MNFDVKTSLGILMIVCLIYADVDQFNKQCQILQCNLTTEICYTNPNCTHDDDVLKCVHCILKNSSIYTQQLSLVSHLSVKSNESKFLVDNHDFKSNITYDESSYDEYYEYDEDETSDKTDLDEDDEYLDDYTESLDTIVNRTQSIRKLGNCPKVVEAIGKCDTEKLIPPECRFDTDCPGDLKCCEAACGRPQSSICSVSFACSLNCRLGYRTDSNGCLTCECQSCPTMDQCNKNCPSGYLKDLFGCNICECNDQCPPFTCNIFCPSDIGFAQSKNGCPLCQCALSKIKSNENRSSCQEDIHCPPGFRCLSDSRNVPICQAVPTFNIECNNDLANTCNLQCPNGNYLLDEKGCPTCACVSTEEKQIPICPQIKCRANCGDAGYQVDENGCQTCKCVSKENIQCSRLMCRMFCKNGFKRDENGCEYCACNELPVQCSPVNCERSCPNGYRKDYSGCQTCDCECPALVCPASTNQCTNGLKKDANGCPTCSCDEQQDKDDDKCPSLDCNLTCKNGLQVDESGCKMCSCNKCQLQLCRMYCMYGFRRNEDGCEMCECDWTPVAEKIQCNERIPCTGTRVCNLNIKLCEKVDPDRVNWFVFEFDIESDMFNDQKFLQLFRNGFINNVAAKYNLIPTQITVSSVELNGLTSFQIMPFFTENMAEFQRKMDDIDADLNSYEFRSVLPAVAQKIGAGGYIRPSKTALERVSEKLKSFTRTSTKLAICLLGFLFILIALIIGITYIHICQRRMKHRSDSKLPIYDASYQQAPSDDDHYHAVHAPDGTAYVVVESDDIHLSNDKRTLV
ncbi:unnamed protein product [Adineta steineri]|uniref:Uncharacterized protein n=2 Tax=Adineta steineri TaxID=433720 RepID=A0A818TUU0_9BILA|nr:unnamed protein product [Adineta steineri]CAF3689896.1 unnamed protein product [Adineta steineri]